MRLRTKFVVVLVAVTLVLSGSVLLALEFYQRDAVAESRSNVAETASLAAEQIDAAIRDRRDYVGLVASRPGARDFAASGAFLEAFLANSRFYAVQLTAANGTVVDFRGDVTDAQRRAVLGANRSNATYVRAALAGRTYVGSVETLEERDVHILVFSAPVFDDGEVRGVLAAALFLDTQTVFDALPALERSGQTVSVVGNGTALHGGDRSFQSAVEASATVPTTGWRVTVTRDRSALDSRLQRLALFQLGQVGLVALVLVGFGYWQYTASLRQTERLLEAFEDLGEGDYHRSVVLRGGTEWEQIADGFNTLGTRLGARERALRERTQRLEVLYRVLRHNLRNQLSVVTTYADVVAEVAADDQVREAARSIREAGARLATLSDRARQIETALEDDQEPTRVDLSRVVAEVVSDIRETYPDVTVTTALPRVAWVHALPSIRIAVEHVCENACEHNDADDPRLEVSVEPFARTGETADDDSERVRVAVADNGPGIPAQERAAIREGRETSLEHGSGLGLWLTYWLVDGSGGELHLEERSPRGTLVELVLPGAAEPTTRAAASEDDSATPGEEQYDRE